MSGADLKIAPHSHIVSILIGGGASDSLLAFWSSLANGIELTRDSSEYAIPLANCRTRYMFLASLSSVHSEGSKSIADETASTERNTPTQRAVRTAFHSDLANGAVTSPIAIHAMTYNVHVVELSKPVAEAKSESLPLKIIQNKPNGEGYSVGGKASRMTIMLEPRSAPTRPPIIFRILVNPFSFSPS